MGGSRPRPFNEIPPGTEKYEYINSLGSVQGDMSTTKPNIAEHPFTKGMIPQHLELLAQSAREVEFEPGQKILHQGKSAFQFYLLRAGRVAIESHFANHVDIPVQEVGAGDALGWSWLFPPFTWHFQARTLEGTKAIFLDGAKLLVACEENHEFGYELMKRIAHILINRLQAARKLALGSRFSKGRTTAISEAPERSPGVEKFHAQTVQAIMAKQPFLKGMRSEHMKTLASCAMGTEFKLGQLIFREGEMANRFYLIERGKVALEAPGPEGEAALIQELGDGDVLGWSWLFPPYYWHFDARAVAPTLAVFLYGTRLREHCEQDPDLGYDLMKRFAQVLIQRLQATRTDLLETLPARANASNKVADQPAGGSAPVPGRSNR